MEDCYYGILDVKGFLRIRMVAQGLIAKHLLNIDIFKKSSLIHRISELLFGFFYLRLLVFIISNRYGG